MKCLLVSYLFYIWRLNMTVLNLLPYMTVPRHFVIELLLLATIVVANECYGSTAADK